MSGISAQYCDGLELRIKELEAENAALRAELAAAKEYHEAYREEMLEQLGELAALKSGAVVMLPRDSTWFIQFIKEWDHFKHMGNGWKARFYDAMLAAAPGVQTGEKDNAEMKATREQVLAMAEEAGFLSHQLSAYEVKLDALVHLAQQFTLDQLRAQYETAIVKQHTGSLKDMAIIVWSDTQPPEGTKLYTIPETLE